LSFFVHGGDLIQKHRATIRLLKNTRARLLRAGERASLMAKNLACDELRRHGTRVDRNIGSIFTTTLSVDRGSDKIFSGPGFAGD
jgi:hypothetical protein